MNLGVDASCDDKKVASKNTDAYVLCKPLTDEIDKMKLKNIILNDNHEHKQKLELGKKIYEIISKNEIHPHSL